MNLRSAPVSDSAFITPSANAKAPPAYEHETSTSEEGTAVDVDCPGPDPPHSHVSGAKREGDHRRSDVDLHHVERTNTAGCPCALSKPAHHDDEDDEEKHQRPETA